MRFLENFKDINSEPFKGNVNGQESATELFAAMGVKYKFKYIKLSFKSRAAIMLKDRGNFSLPLSFVSSSM